MPLSSPNTEVQSTGVRKRKAKAKHSEAAPASQGIGHHDHGAGHHSRESGEPQGVGNSAGTQEAPTLPTSPVPSGGILTPHTPGGKMSRMSQLKELILTQASLVEALLSRTLAGTMQAQPDHTTPLAQQQGTTPTPMVVDEPHEATPPKDVDDSGNEDEWEDALFDALKDLKLSVHEVEAFMEKVPTLHLSTNLHKVLRQAFYTISASKAREVAAGLGEGPFTFRRVLKALIKARCQDEVPAAAQLTPSSAAQVPPTPQPPSNPAEPAVGDPGAGPSQPKRRLNVAFTPTEEGKSLEAETLEQVNCIGGNALHDFESAVKSYSVRINMPHPEEFHGDVGELIPSRYKDLDTYVAYLVRYAIRGDIPLLEVLDRFFKGSANDWLTMITNPSILAQCDVTPNMLADSAHNKLVGHLFKEQFIRQFGKQILGVAAKAFGTLSNGTYGQDKDEPVALYHARLQVLMKDAKVPNNFQRVTYFVSGLHPKLRDKCRTDSNGRVFTSLEEAFDYAIGQENAMLHRANELVTKVVAYSRSSQAPNDKALVANTSSLNTTQARQKRKHDNFLRRQQKKALIADAKAKGTFVPKGQRSKGNNPHNPPQYQPHPQHAYGGGQVAY